MKATVPTPPDESSETPAGGTESTFLEPCPGLVAPMATNPVGQSAGISRLSISKAGLPSTTRWTHTALARDITLGNPPPIPLRTK